ncbi:cytoplasmic dynein 2 heavy chain 1-like [Mercenaria mercenaria]|uniref:cytoplasmic dynein 2 heavy chain 1-like n=1 Tax=Mercenaria mercenaria TaxID=6596 RepID=UPI00234F1C50|nr:cytoplasmic dynein 2 heavy chain 1-like [Mercenaria mercenaria]
MIPSQKTMMLEAALQFEKLAKNPKTGAKVKGEDVLMTWDNPEELEIYIRKLQTAAEKLTTMNRILQKSHFDINDKVQQWMSVDLFRQDKKWKEILTDIRYPMTEITAKVKKLYLLREFTNFEFHCHLQKKQVTC